MKIIDQIIQDIKGKTTILFPEFAFLDGFWEIELPQGAYELVDKNKTIQQIFFNYSDSNPYFKLIIEADTISMK